MHALKWPINSARIVQIWDAILLNFLTNFGSADRTAPACAMIATACVAIIKQNRDELLAMNAGSQKEFHNDVGMLLSESAVREAYFTAHFMPLCTDKATVETLRAVKVNFDCEWAAAHPGGGEMLPLSSTVAPPVIVAAGQQQGQGGAAAGGGEEEYRVDPSDGYEYTKQDFIDAYGGTVEWDAAAPATQPAQEAAAG